MLLSWLFVWLCAGQRKYGGPPPGWEGNTPGAGCEVFCGKIPKDMYEDELIPLFENCGAIWDLRLMMDPMTGTNRGYAFVTFTTRDAAQNAVREVTYDTLFPGSFSCTQIYLVQSCFLLCQQSNLNKFFFSNQRLLH